MGHMTPMGQCAGRQLVGHVILMGRHEACVVDWKSSLMQWIKQVTQAGKEQRGHLPN